MIPTPYNDSNELRRRVEAHLQVQQETSTSPAPASESDLRRLQNELEVLEEVVGLQINPEPDDEADKFGKLTEREREVLQLVTEGYSTKEIGEKLCLSVPTIHTHRQHLIQKLKARNIADLVRYAIRQGIISAD